MLALAQQALKDKRTTHILFCTESCIPITTLNEAAIRLNSPSSISGNINLMDRSFVDAYDGKSSRCTRFDELSCWEKLQHVIPRDAIHKALPGWCLLSTKHARSIVDIPKCDLGGKELWPVFEDVWAPEEMFFPTVLALLGYLPGPEVELSALTYSEWPTRAKNPKDRAHPYTYDNHFSQKLVAEIRESGCLFMRKLKYPLDVDLWKNIVTGGVGESTKRYSSEAYPSRDSKKRRKHYDDC
mmetsp:Transcript_24896/g.25340  ORF Transcript_24896/g.25340 Transcript_24896/m.25340 type:complete len:241 (+) Transcript_24896:715-1437(+)